MGTQKTTRYPRNCDKLDVMRSIQICASDKDNSEINREDKLEVRIWEWVIGLQVQTLIVQQGGVLYHELEIPIGYWGKDI